MKVLYFHQYFNTPKGSVGIRSYVMARKLIAEGHEVSMICGSYIGGDTGLSNSFIKGKREGVVDGIHVIEFDLAYSNTVGFLKRSWIFALFALRSIILIFSEKYDIVFSTTTPLTAGIPGIFARWFKGKPFIFEVRDLWPELPREMGVIKNSVVLGLMSFLEWSSYKSATRLVALSPGIANGIARLGIPHKNIAMIPNGCDLSIFTNPVKSWRPEGVNNTDLMAVFTGTHGIANGLDAVLDVAAELKKRKREDIKIVLMGQGKLKEKLINRAKQEQLDNIIFHDAVDKEKLSELLASADLGLQILANVPAFYYGTSPNKFFDYIASGLPVLNNYPGWLAEMIKEYQCGFSVPPNNLLAFADAMENAADNREKLKEMGARAIILGKNSFDRQKLSRNFVNWLEGAL